MSAKKTPLQQVNEGHGGKAKLVDAILNLVDHGDEGEEGLKSRLLKASNKKLLRLRAVSATVKEKYGSPEKLAGAVADKMGRAKDADFVTRLGRHTSAKLLDMAKSLGKEARPAAKAVKAAVEAVKKPVKKAVAKAKAGVTKAVAKKAPAKKPAKK